MTTINQIESFLAAKKMAIAGVSRDEKKFGYLVFRNLAEKGFEVCPVNPNADEINNTKCYHSVKEIPDSYDRLLVVTPEKQTLEVVKEAIEKGIQHIWIQNKSENKEVLEYIKDKEVDIIFKKCVYMFADPVDGGHKFHRAIVKLFGGYPKRK